MDEAAIPQLETLSRDYSETPRRVLFVLGSGDGACAEIFRRLAPLPHTSIDPQHLEEMAAGSRCAVTISTPMQMVPEIVRSLSRINVAIYQVTLLEDRPSPEVVRG